jgi:hypothetical protein
MVGVRDGDKAFVLCACDMQVLAKGGGVFIATPYAYLFAIEVGVVSPCTAQEAIGAVGAVTIFLSAREADLPL